MSDRTDHRAEGQTPVPSQGPGRSRPRRFRRRFWILYPLFLIVLVETGARFYWSRRPGVGFIFAPWQTEFIFYPELLDPPKNQVLVRDARFNVLLMGGSAVHRDWGLIGPILRERLIQESGVSVRLDVLGQAGHTTRDSLIKYRSLQDQHYDLVMVYHGINDVRTNNFPPDRFRDDYSHYAWYALVNRIHEPGVRLSILPFTFRYGWMRLSERFGLGDFQMTWMPDKEMAAYGSEIKSAGPFRRNLQEIIDIARGRGERVMLMTFAYYLPDNYSTEAFRDRKLDYTIHRVPTHFWGYPEYVVAGIETHNGIVRELAWQNPDVLFVDQEAGIADDGRNFNDICHLTHQGSEAWVTNALPPIIEIIQSRQPAPDSPRPQSSEGASLE